MTLKVTDRVWYDDNPGKIVELRPEGRALVDWDGINQSECAQSDLVKMTDYEANTAFTIRFEEPIGWYDGLPTWIKGAYRNDQEMKRLQASKWTKSTTGEYFYQYTSEGTYVQQWSRE